jgi:hypothetical protein
MQLSALQTAVRQRADIVGSQFVSDSELTSYINQSYFELYDLLVQEYGDNYYVAPAVTFTTDGTSQSYALPNGTNYSAAPALYKLLGVDLQLSPGNTGSYVTLKQFNFSERNRFAIPNTSNFYGVTNLRYHIMGDNLMFQPLASAGQVIQLWYIPRMTQLSGASDTVEGVSGWTEYIIVDAAIKCMQKEESDVSVLMAQKQALIKRIEAAAENRDAGMPATVADVRSDDFAQPDGTGRSW